MRQQNAWLFLTVAVGGGLVTLSCGGDVGRDRIVGPAAPAPPVGAADPGTVTTSAMPAKQAVCHYDQTLDTYSTLNLSAQGATAHLAHHTRDYAGACAAPCPCFGAADFDAAITTCESMASYGLFCAADPESNDGVGVSQVVCPTLPQPTFEYELRVDTNRTLARAGRP